MNNRTQIQVQVAKQRMDQLMGTDLHSFDLSHALRPQTQQSYVVSNQVNSYAEAVPQQHPEQNDASFLDLAQKQASHLSSMSIKSNNPLAMLDEFQKQGGPKML